MLCKSFLSIFLSLILNLSAVNASNSMALDGPSEQNAEVTRPNKVRKIADSAEITGLPDAPATGDGLPEKVDYISNKYLFQDIAARHVADFMIANNKTQELLSFLATNKRWRAFAQGDAFDALLNANLSEKFSTSLAHELVFLYDNRAQHPYSHLLFPEANHKALATLNAEGKADYFTNVFLEYAKPLPYQVKLRILQTTEMFSEGFVAKLAQSESSVHLQHPREIQDCSSRSFAGRSYKARTRMPFMLIPTDSQIMKVQELTISIPFPFALSSLNGHMTHLKTLTIDSICGIEIGDLDLSNYKALNSLTMVNCGIKTVKFPQNDGFKLHSIDLSHNKLRDFSCSGQLSSLNLSHNCLKGKMEVGSYSQQMRTLYLAHNHLTHVLGMTSIWIEYLDVSDNPLVFLSVVPSVVPSRNKVTVKFPVIRDLCWFSSALPLPLGKPVERASSQNYTFQPCEMPEALLPEFQEAFAQEKRFLAKLSQKTPEGLGMTVIPGRVIEGVTESYD